MSTSKRAHTLLEVMVSSALMLLLLGGVYQLVSFALGYWRVARAGETAHQDALVCLRRMEKELAQSHSGWVHGGSGQLIFPSPGGDFSYADEELLWTGWVAFYLRDGELIQAELRFTPTDVVSGPVPTLEQFRRSGTERVLARNVKSFSAGAGYPGLIRLEVTTVAATGTGRSTELTLSTQTRPGN